MVERKFSRTFPKVFSIISRGEKRTRHLARLGLNSAYASSLFQTERDLVCVLTVQPLDIIRLYGWRFKIEASFKQAIHTVGAYAYHFWMQDMNPIRRGHGSQHPHRQSKLYREHVRRKLADYERHIQLGLIAQGLLQYLAVLFRRSVRFNFHSYIRTASPQKPPSEWVVSHALRHPWPQFLHDSSECPTLKKFLASKISLDRCGYADSLGLEKAA